MSTIDGSGISPISKEIEKTEVTAEETEENVQIDGGLQAWLASHCFIGQGCHQSLTGSPAERCSSLPAVLYLSGQYLCLWCTFSYHPSSI